jgi:hypothetical protein
MKEIILSGRASTKTILPQRGAEAAKTRSRSSGQLAEPAPAGSKEDFTLRIIAPLRSLAAIHFGGLLDRRMPSNQSEPSASTIIMGINLGSKETQEARE